MDPIAAVTSTTAQPQQAQLMQVQAAMEASMPAAQAGPSVEAASVARSAEAQAATPVADAAERVMGNIHSTVERLSREVDIVDTTAPSPAEDAKNALMPESGDLAPGGPMATKATSGTGPDSNLAMLNKSFDHAMFMAMINQVISGVGDSSRTLIRQA